MDYFSCTSTEDCVCVFLGSCVELILYFEHVFLEGFVLVLIVCLFPGGDSAESVKVAVEGFEGDYGGVAFEDDSGGFGTAFEGLNGAFGGGLDASEFGATTSQSKDKDLGGLGLIAGLSATPGATEQPVPSSAVDPKVAAELSGVDPNAGKQSMPDATEYCCIGLLGACCIIQLLIL